MSLEKTNVPGYLKDRNSGVVINTQTAELTAFQKQKAAILERKNLQERIKTLEKEMAEQKLMFQKILLEIGILKI